MKADDSSRPPAPPTTAAPVAGQRTRQAGSAPAAPTAHQRVNLPPDLAEEFEPVRDLSTGGQASLLICRRIAAPDEQVVVKLFNTRVAPGKDDPRKALHGLSGRHVVAYLPPYFGEYDGYWWEVMEYCQEGTLRDLANASGGRLDTPTAKVVLRQMVEALEYVHSQSPKIVHRDIKPENILVRTLKPLDVVLTDFGAAVLIQMSREYRSGTRSLAYGAPEAAGGEAAPPVDWWSLGMTLLELVAGRHPYQSNTGVWFSDAQITSELGSRPVPIPDVKDAQWDRLFHGLLTKDPGKRWGAHEVRQWLEGKSPAVDMGSAHSPAAPTVARQVASPPRASVPRSVKVEPVEFAHRLFTDPVALADAMAANWTEAGKKLVSATFHEIVDWAEEHFPDRSLSKIVRDRERQAQNVDATVARVIATLNPKASPVFMGERVDLAALPSLGVRAAKERGQVEAVTEKLFTSRALRSFALLEGHRELLLVDSRWQEHCESARRWFSVVREAGEMTPQVRALILRLAADQVKEEAEVG